MNAKWETIAEHLRNRITNGEYTLELPSENTLMGEHRVSRTTVRRALSQLVAEGLVESSQGSPHRVRADERMRWAMHEWERPERHSTSADAWDTAVLAQGATPGTIVTVAIEPPSEAVAHALHLHPVGELVLIRRRVRLIDEEPHQLGDSYFPYGMVKDHPEFMEPRGLSAPGGLLIAAGLPQARLHDLIEARMPTPDETRLLRIPLGTPLIVHSRTGYLEDGTAIRHMITRMSANRVEITYEIPA